MLSIRSKTSWNHVRLAHGKKQAGHFKEKTFNHLLQFQAEKQDRLAWEMVKSQQGG
jgi:hypothetical protein